jgi:hypothetical protein
LARDKSWWGLHEKNSDCVEDALNAKGIMAFLIGHLLVLLYYGICELHAGFSLEIFELF